ncbi:HEAT repeat domain-containing protein [Salinibacterium sp. TMP30]|uniref:HEAT repeat domain-containing protein n=1 Tax=Salinibacterium sp. TMP30 TaxID=3138237 RepID=UPI00313907A2
MDITPPRDAAAAAGRLRAALTSAPASARLQAAMSAGTHPRPEYIEPLLARCAIEPDLNVRETLTWALMRHPASETVPLLIDEVHSENAQARSQALHTLSKIGDPRGWVAITPEVLNDADDQVARTAWRVAVVLVPEGSELALSAALVHHLSRGDRDVQLSLSRALVALEDAATPLLEAAAADGDTRRRVHATATLLLRESPDEGFDAALFDAELRVMLADAAEIGAEGESEPGAGPESDAEPEPGSD